MIRLRPGRLNTVIPWVLHGQHKRPAEEQLSIFERTRELGVMRAVGMTRPQFRATIRWEFVIIALHGRFSDC